MTNFIEVLYFLLGWFVLGSGLVFILAAAFFGYPEEINKEEYDELSKRE